MWACAVLGFPPDQARDWTRYALACRRGPRADPRRRPRLPEFGPAEYLAMAHLRADALVTVDLELLADADKVMGLASIQDLVANQ
jgi:hypothetical protein